MNPNNNSFADLNARFDQGRLNDLMAQQQAPAQTAQNTNANHGNFLTHLLPSLGGIGGGAAGAAIGTALLPGVGTLAGALIGGALGGGTGKVVENKQEGQGTWNGVARQALENGALSAGPLRLLRGAGDVAKAAPEIATGGKTLADALLGIGKGAEGNVAKNLVTQGEQAQSRIAGFPAGTRDTASAFGRLSPQDSSKMLDILQQNGIKVGNANNMSRDIGTKLNQYGQQIGKYFTDNNTPLATKDVNGIAKDFLNNVTLGGMKTGDQGVINEAQTLANDLKNNVTDTKSLWNFRKSLDQRIPDAKQTSDANLADKMAAIKSMRQYIANKLGDVPGMSQYHDLSNVQQHVLEEANRLNNPGGGIIGRVAASGPVQKGEALAGKAAVKAGKALANPFSVANISSRTLPVAALQGGIASAQAPSTTTTNDMMNNQNSMVNMNGSLPQNDNMSSGSPYGQANLLYDISRDPNNASKYLSIYSALDKVFNPAPAVKPSNQQVGLAQTGMQQLQQLAGMVQQDPNVVNANATPGQGLPIVGSLITNASGAGGYHALADSVMQNLLHLQTGAAASREEIVQAKGQLPLPGDSPEVRQQKITNLMNEFNNYLSGNRMSALPNSAASATTAVPTDLPTALQMLGYGG